MHRRVIDSFCVKTAHTNVDIYTKMSGNGSSEFWYISCNSRGPNKTTDSGVPIMITTTQGL